MKKLLLAVCFCLATSLAFGEVTHKVVGKEIDANGNIVVKTAYFIDGKNVESRYPQMTVKDKEGKDTQIYYWQTRYSIQNFINTTPTEAITKDAYAFEDSLITKPFQEEQRQALKDANLALYNNETFNVVGLEGKRESAKMTVDTDFDGKPDKEWTCFSNQTKTEKPYSIVTP